MSDPITHLRSRSYELKSVDLRAWFQPLIHRFTWEVERETCLDGSNPTKHKRLQQAPYCNLNPSSLDSPTWLTPASTLKSGSSSAWDEYVQYVVVCVVSSGSICTIKVTRWLQVICTLCTTRSVDSTCSVSFKRKVCLMILALDDSEWVIDRSPFCSSSRVMYKVLYVQYSQSPDPTDDYLLYLTFGLFWFCFWWWRFDGLICFACHD